MTLGTSSFVEENLLRCVARRNWLLTRGCPQYSNGESPVIIGDILTRTHQIHEEMLANVLLSLRSLGFLHRNLWTREIRGDVFVGDNADVLERREVSLIGLKKIDVSSAAATCKGYEGAS
ncbi:hypothetical protein A2U01_0050449 [Trifolium medium]|uniref:Uncharacterized protein n=1 Tax=Trifolium medium TaxID=97028 RepID=A0A392R077_9FABA|nr:hypothetical protein [Trifolium medium]